MGSQPAVAAGGGGRAGADAGTSVALVKMGQIAPDAKNTKGPVNLLKYALEHPEMYGETLVGEAAEAAAFDRMWAGAQNDVKPGDLDAAPMVGWSIQPTTLLSRCFRYTHLVLCFPRLTTGVRQRKTTCAIPRVHEWS